MIAEDYVEKIHSFLETTFNKETYNHEEIEVLKSHLDSIAPYTKDKVFSLEDVRNAKQIYISPNIEYFLGIEREYLYKMGPLATFKYIHYSHFSYPFRALKYGKKFGLSVPPNDRKQVSFASCGLKVRNKLGQPLRIFMKSQAISFDKEFKPLIILNVMEDISTLFNGKHYWGRWTYKNQTFSYVNQKGKKEFQDILSLREQEVLTLVKAGESNQSIADILNLSKGTIETHRKNMLRRTGFSNLQALGYIWDKIQ